MGTIHGITGKMYIYMVDLHSRDILVESTQIRWFSRWSGGGGWSFSSKKTGRLESTQIRWFSWQSGVRLVHWNGGWFKGYISKWELENNSGQPNKSKQHVWGSLRKSINLLSFLLDSCEGELKSMKGWWWVRTNQDDHKSVWQRFWVLIRQCLELRLNRQPAR